MSESPYMRLTDKGVYLMEETERRCKARGITDIMEEFAVMDEIMEELKAENSSTQGAE